MTWKIAFALSAAVAVTGAVAGCATDVCTRADDQIAACTPSTVTLPILDTNNTGNECTPRRACQSACINNANCLEINEAQCINQSACRPLSGPPSAFIQCLMMCDGIDGGAGDGGGP